MTQRDERSASQSAPGPKCHTMSATIVAPTRKKMSRRVRLTPERYPRGAQRLSTRISPLKERTLTLAPPPLVMKVTGLP